MATASKMRGGNVFTRPFVRAWQFLQGVWYELKRVVWPSRDETTAFTAVVLIAVLVVAFYMGALDFLLTLITHQVLHLF